MGVKVQIKGRWIEVESNAQAKALLAQAKAEREAAPADTTAPAPRKAEVVFDRHGKAWAKEKPGGSCNRCGGNGYFRDLGVCYRCKGTGIAPTFSHAADMQAVADEMEQPAFPNNELPF